MSKEMTQISRELCEILVDDGSAIYGLQTKALINCTNTSFGVSLLVSMSYLCRNDILSAVSCYNFSKISYIARIIPVLVSVSMYLVIIQYKNITVVTFAQC